MFKKVIYEFLITITTIIMLIAVVIGLDVLIKSIIHPETIPSIFGYKMFFVKSDEMSPDIQSDDLVFVKDTKDKINFKKGDIIAYRTEKNFVVTEKIVDIGKDQSGAIIYDTRNNVDSENTNVVEQTQIEGIFVKRIAKLGKIGERLQEPKWFIIAVSIPSIIIIITLVWESQLDKKERTEKEKYKSKSKLQGNT